MASPAPPPPNPSGYSSSAAPPPSPANPSFLLPPLQSSTLPPPTGGSRLPPLTQAPLPPKAGESHIPRGGAGVGVGAGSGILLPHLQSTALPPTIKATGSPSVQSSRVRRAVSSLAGSSDEASLLAALDDLAAVTAGSAPARSEAGSLAGIPAIVAVINSHLNPPVASVLGSACRALCNIVCDDAGNRDQLRSAAGIEAIVAALKVPASEALGRVEGAFICEAACGALRNACFETAANVTHAVAVGALPCIVYALNNFTDIAPVCRAACDALHMSADKGECTERMRDAGAVKALVDTLKTHTSEPAVVKAACGAIKYMTFRSATNRTEFHKLDACGAITQGMTANQQVASVQEMGCRAIMNLVCRLSMELATPVHLAVVSALRMNGQYAPVARAACGTLRNFCAQNGANRDEARLAGALEAISHVMKVHKDDANVQRPALHALRNLCTLNATNTGRAGEVGCVEAAVAALKNFNKDPTIELAALSCIWVFSFNNAENHDKIVASGGAEQVIIVLRLSPDAEHTTEACLGTLGNVACNTEDDLPHVLRKLGAVKAIKKAMRLHARAPKVQQAGQAALHNIQGTKCC